MRIATSTIYDQGIASLQQQTSRLMQIQQQISASRRILTPADDPSGSARALEVSQSQAISQQYGANIGAAGDSLSLQESTLATITDLLQSARDATNAVGNGGYNQSDRLTLASQLRSQYQELLGLANTKDSGGQYMFSGYQSATAPFSQLAPGTVKYNGDQGQRLIQVGPTRQIEVSDSGDRLFLSIPDGNGNFVTQAGAANTGTALIDNGNTLDVTKWINVVNAPLNIKFAGTATVAAASTNTPGGATGAAGIVNQAQWNAGSKNYSIAFASAAAYDIIDNTTGAHVVTGAAYTSGATISFQGFNAVVTDGAGPVTPQAGDTYTVTASAVAGLTYDIVENTGISLLTGTTAGSPPYARSYAPGASIGLKSQGGEPAFDYGIEATVSGTPAAGDTFSIKASTSQDVFKTLDHLASLLESGTGSTARTNELGRLQLDLDNALNNVISVRASVGSRMKELDGLKTGNDSLDLQYSQTLSRLQDLDYAKAASEFTQQQVTLQAAQQSFVKVAGLSLFNYL